MENWLGAEEGVWGPLLVLSDCCEGIEDWRL